jgi:hypothetical protein
MYVFKIAAVALLAAAPGLSQTPGASEVAAAGVVVTYGERSSSVVVPPAGLFELARPARRGAAVPRAKPVAQGGGKGRHPRPCAPDQNCGSIAPPM